MIWTRKTKVTVAAGVVALAAFDATLSWAHWGPGAAGRGALVTTVAEPTVPGSADLAGAAVTTGSTDPSSTAPVTSTAASLSGDPTDTTATPAATPVPVPAVSGPPAAPVTTAGARGPVTTVTGSAPVDPAGIYRGVVGLLGPDDPVAPPVAAPPAVAAGLQPLTGWPGPVPARPAAVVKIDNSRAARPQTGIEAADLVFEEEVEGGVTRLAAVFQSQGGVVGPVRSGRTTDIPVVVSLGTPLLLYSGANEVTDTLLRRPVAVQNRAANRSSGYWRDRGRKAPSNLFTDLQAHWASASGDPPPAQFSYREPGVVFPGAPATGLTLSYRSNRVTWAWNGELWARSQGGQPHTVTAGGQLAVANVVVIQTRRVDTGMVDTSGATVPEFVFVGSGPASVYSDGKRLDGTWTRPTLASPATLTTPDGAVITLTPGRTWIQIVDADGGIFQP